LSFPLFFDEHVDEDLAVLLTRDGFDILTTQAAGRANQRLSDEDQLVFAAANQRAIFTHNARDFEPLAKSWFTQGRQHSGIIISNFKPPWELQVGHRLLQEQYPGGIADFCLRLPA